MSTKDRAQRDIDEMREINHKQKEYYENTSAGWISEVNSFGTNLWSKMRHRAMVSVSDEQRQRVYDIHRAWLGDLSDKKVLDLGAGSGSPLSGYLAQESARYDAIELSKMQLDTLRSKIGGGPARNFIEGDFLDADTTDNNYDVIYAHAVLHHFKYQDVLLDLISEKLSRDGTFVCYEPLQTWLPIRLLRLSFRPFQSDAEWEFPLLGKDIKALNSRFQIDEKLGVFNWGKWALILGVLSPSLGRRFGDKLFAKDFTEKARRRSLKSSLHISFLMSSKE